MSGQEYEKTSESQASLNILCQTPGEFALASLNDPSSDLPQLHRAGAISKSNDPGDERQLKDSSAIESEFDMPKVVWLRGDEAWFHQFDLNAQDAMEILGIKRSRLTQISGHELRVGRIRVDRYIKPVYRSIDVNAYKEWSRTTVTAQKSTQALKTAVDALEHHANQLHDQVTKAQHETYKLLLDETSTFWLESLDLKTQRLRESIQQLVEEKLNANMLLIREALESTISHRIDASFDRFEKILQESRLLAQQQLGFMELSLTEAMKLQFEAAADNLRSKSDEWQGFRESWAAQVEELRAKVNQISQSNHKTKLNACRKKRSSNCGSQRLKSLNLAKLSAHGPMTSVRKKTPLSKFTTKRRLRDF